MKVCFDTCTVIDILGKTEWFLYAYASYDLALLRGFEPCLSVSSTTDIAYLLHSRGFYTKKDAAELTKQVLDQFTLLDNTGGDCRRACASPMADYEDALIAQAAFQAGAELIVTRNKKDYAESPVSAVTPEEFVNTFKGCDYDYELLDLGEL